MDASLTCESRSLWTHHCFSFCMCCLICCFWVCVSSAQQEAATQAASMFSPVSCFWSIYTFISSYFVINLQWRRGGSRKLICITWQKIHFKKRKLLSHLIDKQELSTEKNKCLGFFLNQKLYLSFSMPTWAATTRSGRLKMQQKHIPKTDNQAPGHQSRRSREWIQRKRWFHYFLILNLCFRTQLYILF